MATYSILSQTFEISESSKKFLESYLARVDTYIRRHNLDAQLLDDLSERLLEKLSVLKSGDKLSEKEIISIVNGLGEPEDIFRDSIESEYQTSSSRITKADVKDFFRREFHRNSRTGIILGVCSGLAETLEVNPIWVRIFFIIMIPAYGSAFLLYIILGILLPDSARGNPVQDPKDAASANAKAVADDIHSVAKNIESGVTAHAGEYRDNIFVRIFRSLGEMIRITAYAIIKIIIFCTLIGIASAFFGTGFGIIGMAGFALAHPIIENQDIFRALPSWLPSIGLACGIAGIVLSIMIGARAIGKEIGSGWFAIVCVIILGAGFFSVVYSGTAVIGSFQNTYSTGATQSFEVASGSTLSFEVDNVLNGRKNIRNFIHNGDRDSFEILPSEDGRVHVQTKTTIRTSAGTDSSQILGALQPIVIELKNGKLDFSLENERDFKEVVPLTFVSRELQIFVPKSVKIEVSDDSYGRRYYNSTTGIEPSEKMRKYGVYSCGGLTASYDSNEKVFMCNDEGKIKKAILASREDFIREQDADFFSDDVRGWVRIKNIENTGSGVAIVTWSDNSKVLNKTRLEFGEMEESGEISPVLLKKEAVSSGISSTTTTSSGSLIGSGSTTSSGTSVRK